MGISVFHCVLAIKKPKLSNFEAKIKIDELISNRSYDFKLVNHENSR